MHQPTRRDFLKYTTAAGAVACTPWPANLFAAESTAGTRPNIIVCMVDDMGFSDPACFGGEIDTPNLDRLAAGGVRFTNFHNTSRCCPSRASVMTGLYPHQTGVGYMTAQTSHRGYQGGLANPCVTMAEVVGPAGYSTAISGKWHLTPMPQEMGFQTTDTWFAYGATGYFFPLDKDGVPSKETDPTFYATDYYADGVVDFIEKQAGTDPFFVYWTPTAPHYPIHAKEVDVAKYRKRYAGVTPEDIARKRHARMVELGLFSADQPWDVPEIVKTTIENWYAEYRLDTSPLGREEGFKEVQKKSRNYDPYGNTSDLTEVMSMYAAMVDRFDQGMGRVLAMLEKTGQMENTLIFFCSDNGCSGERLNIGPQLSNASTTPFLHTKKSAYHGGIGTPLIMHWPAATPQTQRGSINRTFGHLVDVMATVVAASGATYPDADRKGRPVPAMEGRSLLDSLKGETVPLKKPIFIEHGGNCAVITEKWKITSDRQEPWRLFDLTVDRFERNDLAANHPEIVTAMAAQWQTWADRVGALRTGEPKEKKK